MPGLEATLRCHVRPMMVGLARVLARQPSVALPLMMRVRNLVVALRLRAMCIYLHGWRLVVVIGVNFLLSLCLHQERGENSNCEGESQ